MIVDGLMSLHDCPVYDFLCAVSFRMRKFKGENPVFRMKNFPNTDWSENPRLSAIFFMSMSVHSNILRASAHKSSSRWKRTVCPVTCFIIRDK